MANKPITINIGGHQAPVIASHRIPPNTVFVMTGHKGTPVQDAGDVTAYLKHVAQGDILAAAQKVFRAHAGSWLPVDQVKLSEGMYQRLRKWDLINGPHIGNARGIHAKARPHDRLKAYWKVAPAERWDAFEAIHRLGGDLDDRL